MVKVKCIVKEDEIPDDVKKTDYLFQKLLNEFKKQSSKKEFFDVFNKDNDFFYKCEGVLISSKEYQSLKEKEKVFDTIINYIEKETK